MRRGCGTDEEAGGTADDETEPLQAPDHAFQAILDRHGYGFQYALLKHINGLGRPWFVQAAEFPVTFRGGTTHIDLVLRLARHGAASPLWMVAECKRANPALVDWCFVRQPMVPRPTEVAFEQVRVTDNRAFVALDMRDSWASERVYNLGFPIKGLAKGDASGSGRTALDDAVTQVLRGANGFIELLAHRPKLLTKGAFGYGFGQVLPAVFTTARLWVSDVDLQTADLKTGNVPPASLQAVPWLWLKHNVSPDLKHALPSDEPVDAKESLRDYLLWDHYRCVAIVSATGLKTS